MKNTGNSSIASGASASGTVMPCMALAHTSMSATGSVPGSPPGAAVQADIRAHALQHVDEAVRVGLIPTLVITSGAVAARQPATMKKAAEEKSAGTASLRGPQRLAALERDRAALAQQLDPERAQHALGVIARGGRLGDAGATVGDQRRRAGCGSFTWALATGSWYWMARNCRGCPGSLPAAPVGGADPRAHQAQWRRRASHRATHQRTVTDQGGIKALRGEQPHHQAHRGAGIAEDRERRRRRALRAHPMHRTSGAAQTLDHTRGLPARAVARQSWQGSH